MRKKLIVPPAAKTRLQRVVGRPARRREGVVLARKVDRAAYRDTARTVDALIQVVSDSLAGEPSGSLTDDARQGLFHLAVTLSKRAEAEAAAAELRRALTAAGLPHGDDRQLQAIEQKIVDYTRTADQLAQEIVALLRTVEVLVARRAAARFSGPVSTEAVKTVNLHLARIDALASGIEETAGLGRPATVARPVPVARPADAG